MAEFEHHGEGDFVQGDKIHFQVNQGPYSTYIEQQVIQYIDHQIPRLLTTAPFVPDVFEGRDSDYDQIYSLLHQDSRPLLLLNGEGGIGKTSLAAYYWQRQLRNYNHFAWLFVQDRVEDALFGLAPALHVHAIPGEDTEAYLARLLAALANLAAPSLLVLDNVNDPVALHRRYPALAACSNLHVLYTTRCAGLSEVKEHHVVALERETALMVFRKHFPGHRAEEDWLFYDVYEGVGGNTLVLELLAKNLARINRNEEFYPFPLLVAELQELGLLAISQTEEVSVIQHEAVPRLQKADPKAVIRALYSQARMPQPLANVERKLLSNFSVLPAESLAYSSLKQLLSISKEEARGFSKDLEGLAERGWIEGGYQGKERHYRISPVVQYIIRDEHMERLWADVAEMAKVVGGLLAYQGDTKVLIYIGMIEAIAVVRWAEAIAGNIVTPHQWISVLCEGIGSYYEALGFLALGQVYYKRKLEIDQALWDAEPSNPDYQNNLAIAYEKLGDTYVTLGQGDAALEQYKESLRLTVDLYSTFPKQTNFKNNLAISYCKLGQAYTALGQLGMALENYQEYYRLNEEQYSSFPEQLTFKYGFAVSHEKLGDISAALGQLSTALEHYKKETELFKELHSAFLDHVTFKHGLAISYGKLGGAYAILGQPEAALEYYREYHHLNKELYSFFPDHVGFKYGLAVSYSKLGEIYAVLGQLDLAWDQYKQDARLAEELYRVLPANVDFKNGLAVSYEKLGAFAHKYQNDPASAKTYFEQAEQLWSALVHDAHGFVEYQRNLNQVRRDIQALEDQLR